MSPHDVTEQDFFASKTRQKNLANFFSLSSQLFLIYFTRFSSFFAGKPFRGRRDTLSNGTRLNDTLHNRLDCDTA